MTATDKPKRRRWFRFSLRTLLVAVTACSIWFGWWCHRAREQQSSVAAIKQLGGWSYYDFQLIDGKLSAAESSAVPKWLLDRLGYDFFHNVVEVNLVYNDDSGKRLNNANFTDEALAHLSGLPKLRRLLLIKSQASDDGLKHVGKLGNLEELFMWDAAGVSDAGIAHLSELKHLKYVHCSNSQITDESLRILAGLPKLAGISAQRGRFTDKGLLYVKDMVQLAELELGLIDEPPGPEPSSQKPITDAGLVHLKRLTNLTRLDLQNTQVTSQGLKNLAGLTNLKELWLFGCNLTNTSELQQALPNCQIDK